MRTQRLAMFDLKNETFNLGLGKKKRYQMKVGNVINLDLVKTSHSTPYMTRFKSPSIVLGQLKPKITDQSHNDLQSYSCDM